jgi:outer membrane receptor protein involved in Fe transport
MRTILTLAALAAATATCAAAQEPPAPPPAAAPERGVITYPAAYFAPMGVATALEMVQRTPGFSFDSGANVRGFAGGAGNVLIDGERPLTKSETLDEILKRIPTASVARIEVIRGGAPGIDMQGRTVLANVVRKGGGGVTGAVQASAFALWDGRVLPGVRAEMQRRSNGRLLETSLVIGQGPDDQTGDGRRIRISGTGQTLIRSEIDAGGSGIRIWTTGAYETPFAGGRLRLNGVIRLNPLKDDYTDRLIIPGGVETERDRIAQKTAEFGGRFSRPLTAHAGVELLVLESLGQYNPRIEFTGPGLTRDFELDKRTGETIGRAVLKYRPRDDLGFELGGEGAFNWLKSRTDLTVNGVPIALPAANVRVEEQRGEGFLEATWQAAPTLTLEAGLHAEASKITSSGDTTLSKTLFFAKPRAVATWSPNPTNQVRLRLEREVGQLNFDDFVAPISVGATGTPIAGNPDIEPQQAWVLEAAYEHRFWRGAVIGLTLRRYWLNDVVDRIAVFGGGAVVIDAPGNLGEGSREEAAAQLTLPLGRFGITGGLLKGQVTVRHTEVMDQVTGEMRAISGLRPIEWELHFSQDLPRARLNWGIDVLGRYRERYYRVTEVETKDVRTYVILYGEYKLRPKLLLRGEIQNLTARGVTRDRRVYAGPRSGGTIAYIDTRDLQPGVIFLVRIRRIFG